MGFDCLETYQAKCDEELALGFKAKKRLEQLISSGTARILESGKFDRCGRTLATLTVDGMSGPVLISDGLARPYNGRKKRESWCQ